MTSILDPCIKELVVLNIYIELLIFENMYKYSFLVSRIFIFLESCISNVCNLIFGIGTDMIEVERIKKQLVENKGLKEVLFTKAEIEYCDSKRYPEQHYAARYAAKEAFFKAAGTGWGSGYAFSQAEVLHNEGGRPVINVTGKALEFIQKNRILNISVSISHLKETASAFVILEAE